MSNDAKRLEEKAHQLLSSGSFEEAYQLFKKAAALYKEGGNHRQAALCFASAAGCWGIRLGEKTFFEAGHCYQEAAGESEADLDFHYASLLYKYAAINYERDGEFLNFSECLYRSKECYRKFLLHSLVTFGKFKYAHKNKEELAGIGGFIKGLLLWMLLTFSYFIWGHGERPSRTFSISILVILLSALIYMLGSLLHIDIILKPRFSEALYFSVVTFTTVGYGDITPIGISKFVASLEALSGIFLMSIFVVGLSRKYLKV